MPLKCYRVSGHTCTKLVPCHPCTRAAKVPAGERAAGCSPSEPSWVTLLECKPLGGNRGQHPFASRGQTHRGVQGPLGTIPWLQLAESRQGKDQLAEGHKPGLALRR